MRVFMKGKKSIFIVLLLVLALTFTVLAGCSGGQKSEDKNNEAQKEENKEQEKQTIVIGSKNFSEQFIIGEMFAQVIEAEGFDVERKFGMSGTGALHEALKNGEIDIYPEYTGTGLKVILKKDVITDPDKVYNIVKEKYDEKWNLKWLKSLGFNNTYCLTMKKSKKEELGIETYSDLKKVAGKLRFGCSHEFRAREDGYPGLKKQYDMEFKSVKGFDPGLMYKAIKNDQVDVISAFATDGRIPAFNLVNLKDDKNFFPPYYCAPVVRGEITEKYPQLKEALNKLAGTLDNEKMQKLNYQMDKKGKTEQEIAKSFLQEKGLLK